MKNETEFEAIVARMMGETKRMQFTATGDKALPPYSESEITINDLLKDPVNILHMRQINRVIHADTHRYVVDLTKPYKALCAVIEIYGIYSN